MLLSRPNTKIAPHRCKPNHQQLQLQKMCYFHPSLCVYVYTYMFGILVGENSKLQPRPVLDGVRDVLLARSWPKM